jgi:hypothetical protein
MLIPTNSMETSQIEEVMMDCFFYMMIPLSSFKKSTKQPWTAMLYLVRMMTSFWQEIVALSAPGHWTSL